MKKIVLRADAVFLGLAGFFGVLSDLISYFAGKGAFGKIFYQNPLVISPVEAHLFGVMTAGLLWYFSRNAETTVGNWLGIAFHLICGVSNIIWFDVFYLANAPAQGFIVTILHFLFITLNAFVIFGSDKKLAVV